MSRPLIIDSFAGGGGASEGIRAALGRDPDYALNHNAIALAMHRINHPDTHHVEEDVWNVDAVSLCAGRPVGLLWMSPDCFPAGTLVLTRAGYRPIEEIGVGDEVLTHKNRWRKVIETSQSYRPLVTLKGHGHPGLTLSIEHPVYARRREDVWSTEKPRGYRRILQEADWVPASALDRGWYWASPHHFPVADIPPVGGRGFCLDSRLMWLVGRYLGDGWTRRTDDRAEIVLTCGRHEVENLRRMLDVWPREGDRCESPGEVTWHERETTTAYQFTANHRGLVEWLREHFGHRAEAKGLPGWVLGLPRFLRSELLKGYVSADGWRGAEFTETRTVSAALAFSMKALVASLDHVATVHRGRNSAVIEGRHVEARTIYMLRWRHEPSEQHAQVVRDDDHDWAPIRDQADNGEATRVFNIGVEEDESYVVEGIIVHNCKHFSKAKGGKPREKAIRGLAWVGMRWIKSLPKWQRPRAVFLENVEEFQDWGPLLDDGRPCPLQRGATFRSFIAAFHAMGYAVEWRELRACDYGAPTIRKRLFLVARRDGKPIAWPAPTHGGPANPEVIAGRLKPWRTAAEIIDWSLPCPSIFDTSAEIKTKYGIRANRPLAENTMARIAKGTWRYVVTAAKPFLVSVNHGDSRGRREYDIDDPANTMTASRGEALITPFVSYGQQGGANRDAGDPLHTLTASAKDQNAVVAPFVTKFNRGATGHPIDEPLHTVTSHASETHGGGAAPLGVVASFLAPRYQEKAGHEPRVRSVEEPTATIVGGGNVPGHLVSGFLVPRYGERPGQEPRTRSLEEPAPVVVPTGNEGSLAAIHMTRQFGASVGSGAEEPVGTVTAGGAGKTGVVAAFLAQHNLGVVGHDAREPLSTISQKGSQQQVVAAHMLNLRGSDRRDGPVDAPAPTFSSGGNHAAAVYAFLAKYYGEGLPSQAVDEPLHTITAKPRHGVVTVTIQGQPYAIVDIGMRMLTPRERFNAQGFRRDYTIDRGELEDGSVIPLTLEQQGAACGNSVCPDLAEALVAANADALNFETRRPSEPAPMTLFAAE